MYKNLILCTKIRPTRWLVGKGITAKSYSLSLIPGIHMVERQPVAMHMLFHVHLNT